MKTKFTLFLFTILVSCKVYSQNYVTIPNPIFANWLQQNYPSCMNGNQMDTTCPAILNTTSLNLTGFSINNLFGVQYFLNLTNLKCAYNQLTELPTLPNGLLFLFCDGNQLTELPSLPAGLLELRCTGNQLTSLPTLPEGLNVFGCAYNQLTSLPTLPEGISELYCNHNQLAILPHLPEGLINFTCQFNQLTELPTLPDGISYLFCQNNQITCFPILPNILPNYFNITNNPFTCLPNYTPEMNSDLLAYPLCQENDFVNNPSGCNPAKGILGSLFFDSNSNCNFDNSENAFSNVRLKLYNESDLLIRQTNSAVNGIYQFPIEFGNYRLEIDTLNKPFGILCQSADTTLTIDAQNPLIDSVNFALTCKPGFDVGVQSVITNGWVFPGQNHELKIFGGDISQYYNLNCAQGISGEVQISIYGPVTFQNPSLASIVPTISGNTYTYSVPDFALGNILTPYSLIFQTDTTAQTGDEICVTINVTPELGDNNLSNNTYEYCYSVVNSYDPNEKEVYPKNVLPGYDDYLTYTIHFQNTGSAPAFNIRLLDTLDTNLDLETFEVVNYSHFNKVNVIGNQLNVYFPNIMLPDSTSNLEGSKGYVQYRIKPKPNLPLGTEIKNTAYIYFDFNDPIVTNTATTEFINNLGLNNIEDLIAKVYPNPFQSSTTVLFSSLIENSNIVLYSVLGQEVKRITNFSGNKLQLEKGNLSSGMYYLKVENENFNGKIKLMIQE